MAVALGTCISVAFLKQQEAEGLAGLITETAVEALWEFPWQSRNDFSLKSPTWGFVFGTKRKTASWSGQAFSCRHYLTHLQLCSTSSLFYSLILWENFKWTDVQTQLHMGLYWCLQGVLHVRSWEMSRLPPYMVAESAAPLKRSLCRAVGRGHGIQEVILLFWNWELPTVPMSLACWSSFGPSQSFLISPHVAISAVVLLIEVTIRLLFLLPW